jgi:membrane-associated phospholipid phosphatase
LKQAFNPGTKMRDDRNLRRPVHMVVAGCLSLAVLAAPAGLAAQSLSTEQSRPSSTSTSLTRVAPAPSMQGIVADAVQDFRNIPSLSNVAILVAGGFGAAIGHRSDKAVTRSLSTSSTLDSLFTVGETIGGARSQLLAAVGTYAVGRISGQNKVSQVGADLIKAQILAQTMTAGIKMSVRRERPDGTMYSFPSGHSSVTFATATVLQRDLGWKVGIPAYGLATYVAASRIQDKRHFLSDVTFGAAIGIVAGRSVTVGHGNAKFAVAPSAAPGGGGISFTWLGSR